jgi:hypothetical protein
MNNIKHIIGLIGKKHSGKDMFYNLCIELYLERKISLPSKRFAFADAVKDEYCMNKNISRLELNRDKELHRVGLQELGTNRRKDTPNYWVKKIGDELLLFNKYPYRFFSDHLIIVTDCRFQNEATFIQELGGKLIRIRRDETDSSNDTHISETELENIPYDYPLRNEGKKDLYKMQILDTLKQLSYDH